VLITLFHKLEQLKLYFYFFIPQVCEIYETEDLYIMFQAQELEVHVDVEFNTIE
jgi:hypothetical protein